MARILITGASGFIGGYLVERALKHGHQVTAALRPSSDRTRLSDPRLTLLDLPLENLDTLTERLQKAGRFDWVIHNAGVTKALTHEGYREGNTENTRRLTTALQSPGLLPDQFLFVSSLAALGAAPLGNKMIQRDQIPSPLTTYGESKRQTELYLESLGPEFPWVVVQPTAVYGPWERDILTVIRMAKMGLELNIGRNSQRLSFIHAADVAGAILHILESGKPVKHQKFILSDGQFYTTEILSEAIRAALGGKKTLKIKLPLGLIRQVAGISETIGRWKKKPSPLNRDKLSELAAENWHCDASPLFEDLQYKAEFDLYRGMEHTVAWYRQAGWL